VAQKFPYEKASTILAEAELFGDDATAKRWGITTRTIYNYRDRATSDAKLSESFILKKRVLLVNWQADATKTIKVGLSELNRRIPIARSEEDAKVIHAIAGAIKIVGELKIASDALSEPESSVSDSRLVS
jgi:hypothetical protein